MLDKGQEDDWFGALWVRWAVAALIFGFIGWIWRSWSNPRGLVDLHVLKNRNFRTGCFLIALLGMCIYITIAILPLYYQEILGYTAFTAGLVVGPRGIGSFIGSPVIGLLGSRIDNRKLLSAGFIGFGVCSLIFGTVNLDIGPYTLAVSHPAHRVCAELRIRASRHHDHSTLSREEMGNATGLFNMLRNIGGSIGIAMATTAIIRRAALHQTEIGANLSPSSAVFQQKSRHDHHVSRSPDRPAFGASRIAGLDVRTFCSNNRRCWPTSTSFAGPPFWPSSAPRRLALRQATQTRRASSRSALISRCSILTAGENLAS